MSVDLREIIKVTENEICILNEGKTRHIKTENLFHLPTLKEIDSQKEPQMKVIIANDYALCCGAFALENPFYHQNRFCFYPIQSFFMYKCTEGFGRLVQSTNNFGHSLINWDSIDRNSLTIVPQASFDIEGLIKFGGPLDKQLRTGVDEMGKDYYYIEVGEFPSNYVGKNFNNRLEQLYKSNILVATGKTYLGFFDKKTSRFVKNEEFVYDKKLFVRTRINRTDKELNNIDRNLCDGNLLNNVEGDYLWVKVEPIKWKVLNVDETQIAIQKNFKRHFKIKVQAKNGLISGIPFVTNLENANDDFWQNNLILSYLNGQNIKTDTLNNTALQTKPTKLNVDFEEDNFLTEAFTVKTAQELEELSLQYKTQEEIDYGKSPAEIYRDKLIKKALEKKNNKHTKDESNKDNSNNDSETLVQ